MRMQLGWSWKIRNIHSRSDAFNQPVGDIKRLSFKCGCMISAMAFEIISWIWWKDHYNGLVQERHWSYVFLALTHRLQICLPATLMANYKKNNLSNGVETLWFKTSFHTKLWAHNWNVVKMFILMIQLSLKFANITTVKLSWHVQNRHHICTFWTDLSIYLMCNSDLVIHGSIMFNR